MVLMEAAMKIASFTDASIFLLIDTPEGRSWVGRKNLKEDFINGRMQIRPNDVEFDVISKYAVATKSAICPLERRTRALARAHTPHTCHINTHTHTHTHTHINPLS